MSASAEQVDIDFKADFASQRQSVPGRFRQFFQMLQ
jgi:hypothetical protein